jgi:diguanylate cyclase (GGDEF)-like protein
MKIVSPGMAVRETPSDLRRGRLGRIVCATIVLGWAITALLGSVLGTLADRNAYLLAAVGAVTGAVWATKRWSEQPDRSLQVLLLAASLEACAAAIAFDRGVIAAWPFAILLAVVAGQVGRTRTEVAWQAGVLAVGQLLAGVIGPDRAAASPTVSLVVAGAIMALALGGRLVMERRASVGTQRAIATDLHRLHERLSANVAADPQRFAVLTMDVQGMDMPDVAAFGQALSGQLRGTDLVAQTSGDQMSVVADTDAEGAAALARRIEEAMAAYTREEIGHMNAAIGIAMYPSDGRTPDELLASADAALAEVRAAAAAAMRAAAAAPAPVEAPAHITAR